MLSDAAILPGESPADDLAGLTDRLFREESGRLVAILTGLFGVDRLQLAEDVVQESLVRAWQAWPVQGVPQNPAAWLTQTAKNLALDVLRREKWLADRQARVTALVEDWARAGEAEATPAFESELCDQRLRLLFVCCHPQIPPESQIALALRTLGGFSPAEIARAFLTSEAAVAKRLVRARQQIRRERLPFEFPAGNELPLRLNGVLQSLYLMFNEGHQATRGEFLIRAELCREAIRLTRLLAGHPVGDQPRVHALAAMMLLHGARLPARTNSGGQILRLREQDRSLWDQGLMARGMWHLSRSAQGAEVSEFHLEAAIAACHAVAPSVEATDWRRVLSLYDQLLTFNGSPVVALNRAVALAEVAGVEAGRHALRDPGTASALATYPLFHAVLAEFEARLENHPVAIAHLRTALRLTELESERELLNRRLLAYEGRVNAMAR